MIIIIIDLGLYQCYPTTLSHAWTFWNYDNINSMRDPCHDSGTGYVFGHNVLALISVIGCFIDIPCLGLATRVLDQYLENLVISLAVGTSPRPQPAGPHSQRSSHPAKPARPPKPASPASHVLFQSESSKQNSAS